jgi:hypothetical protein
VIRPPKSHKRARIEHGPFADLVSFLCSRVGDHAQVTADGEVPVVIGEGQLEAVEDQPANEFVFRMVGALPRSLRLHPALVTDVSLAGATARFKVMGMPVSVDFDMSQPEAG